MDQNQIVEKARQFARNAYAARVDEIVQTHRREIANTTAKLASQGLALSSSMVIELARINGSQIRELTIARLDAILEGYELHGVSIDDQMAVNLCDEVIQGMNQMAYTKAPPLAPNLMPESDYQRMVLQSTGLNAAWVKTQIDRRRLTARKNEGSSTSSIHAGISASNLGNKMPRSATIIHVLISSPSDLNDERDTVTRAIQVWNAAHLSTTGIMLNPVRWETHSFPASGDRPQAIINSQIVDSGDLLIGIFGNRLGTPTGEAQSGTIEEIERFRKAGKYVALYFSTADVPRNADRDQLKALEDYQKERKKDTLYATFRSCEELQQLVSQHLPKIVAEVCADLQARNESDGMDVRRLAAQLTATVPKPASIREPLISDSEVLELPTLRPRIIPIRYGPAGDAPRQDDDKPWYKADRRPFTPREILAGKHQIGHHGLYIENETDESAFEISIDEISLKNSTLRFKNYTLPRLVKADGHAFFEALIERSPGSILFGSGLRDQMIEDQLAEIPLRITYKDAMNRWYVTIGKIERDTQGLSVRFAEQKRRG